MTVEKVTLTETNAILPRSEYIDFSLNIFSVAALLECIEGSGDDLFQAAVLRECVYLLVRTFPTYLEACNDE